MRERTYLWMRFAFVAAIAVAAPFLAFSSRYGLRGWALVIFEAFVLGVATFLLWRIRRTPVEARFSYGPSPETIRNIAAKRSRAVAFVPLGLAALLLANEHYGFVYDWKLHFLTVLITPLLVLAGLAGIIYPDLMFGARNDVPDIPEDVRRIARVLIYGGLAIGLFGCYYYFLRR